MSKMLSGDGTEIYSCKSCRVLVRKLQKFTAPSEGGRGWFAMGGIRIGGCHLVM